ncbi:hypothetical protein AZI85_10715 [Bdellovibrio bacteriovorus]|uniref:Lipoprotein n=1 Tax=Bdellovibrio bacteriovorus TaxID=959 RepID=A0A150WDC3_BDEBC|nr:hypothetical protein [Bdellovibrio bacteriovorus]KYG60919.1 hypothetical protein AZI85_10715 [Bdellovibrio bacteriovorus]
MEKLILKSFLALSFLTIAACSPAEVTDVSGIDSNTAISGSFQEYDANKIQGIGTIRFTTVLPVSSSRSLALKTSLDNVSSSWVSTVFYSSNAAIPSTNGVAVTFTRSGASVTAQISINGNSSMVSASKLTFLVPTALDLIVEVHNVNSKARVLIWRRDQITYSPAVADVDTERSGDLVSSLPTQTGGGGFVGLIIQNSTVTAARVDLQKVLD